MGSLMPSLVFKDQILSSCDLTDHTGIHRNEIHSWARQGLLNLEKIKNGQKELYKITWDDYAQFRHKSKNKKENLLKKVKVFTNAKGGVGKSALATALTEEACYRGYKVLAIDFDPQGQFTYNLGLSDYRGPTFKDCFDSKGQVKRNPFEGILTELNPLLSLVPSNISLSGAEFFFRSQMSHGEMILKEILTKISPDFDLVVIDTNPSITMLLSNAIMAADHVLIPALTDFNSHLGLEFMEELLRSFFRSPDTRPLVNIIPNGFDPREKISKESLQVVRENYASICLESKIRYSTDLIQAHKLQKSINQYKKRSPVVEDIKTFSDEVLQ